MTAAAPAAVPPPPVRPWRTTLRHAGLALAGLGVLAWAWHAADVRPLELIASSGNMAVFLKDFARPDLTDWRFYAEEMAVTLAMAVWGSAIAVAAAIPLGLLAAANLSPWWLRQPVRRLLDLLRAVNEVVFALMFVAAVGLGPFAGVLALAVHTTGILGKLFSEVVESIDPGPVEGIRATGANRLEEILYGVVPQVLPMWTSYALYRFESNVRGASVVGIVGAGGIGVVLWELMRSFSYAQAAAALLIVLASVVLIDIISARIRAGLV